MNMIATMLIAVAMLADECTVASSEAIFLGDTIAVVATSDVSRRVIRKAIDHWRGCSEYGTGFPAFTTEPERSSRWLSIEHARTSPTRRCGGFHGSTVSLYSFARDKHGRVSHCGSLEQNLAHELGHALGLADAPKLPLCHLGIMAKITPDNARIRRVSRQDCRVAATKWVTSREQAAQMASLVRIARVW